MSSKTFIITRVLTLTETLPITDTLTPWYMIPGEFVGFFRTRESPDVVLDMIVQRAENQVLNAVYQEERYSLRDERRRPWAWKTRRPFRGRMDRETPTFSEKLRLAEMVALEVTGELGPPWEKASTGKPPVYDPVKLGAALLVKGTCSFNDIATELRNVGYDATLEKIGRTPCASEMHYAFSKLGAEWLQVALARLDEHSTWLLENFDEALDLFVTDGSALTCEGLEERTYAMKRRLVRRTYPYTALMRLPTNTVRGIKGHTNRIAPFLSLLKPGNRLLADPEFDVEENYRLAWRNDIDLQVRQRGGEERRGRRYYRKRARRRFDQKKYGKRKLGERFFANAETRGYRCYYRKEEHRYKGALLVGCEHNVLAYFKNKAWSEQFAVIILGKPPPICVP